MVFKMSRLRRRLRRRRRPDRRLRRRQQRPSRRRRQRRPGRADDGPATRTLRRCGCSSGPTRSSARIRRQPADRVRQRAGGRVSPTTRPARSTTCRPARSIWRGSERERSTGVGVTSFQPLLAPLLVDSHDLQAAVFEAGIPAEMIAGLDDIDLAGIGVLPGPMRKSARRVTPVRVAVRLRRRNRRDPGLGDSPSRRCSRSAPPRRTCRHGKPDITEARRLRAVARLDRRQRLSGKTPGSSPPTSTSGHGRRCCS